MWLPRHGNLLEDLYTPLTKALMRKRPHNKTFRKEHSCVRVCVRVSERVVPNQSMLRVCTLAKQSNRGSDLHILPGQVRSNTYLVGFLRHASPIGSASPSSRSSYLTAESMRSELTKITVKQKRRIISHFRQIFNELV